VFAVSVLIVALIVAMAALHRQKRKRADALLEAEKAKDVQFYLVVDPASVGLKAATTVNPDAQSTPISTSNATKSARKKTAATQSKPTADTEEDSKIGNEETLKQEDKADKKSEQSDDSDSVASSETSDQ